MFRRLMVMVAVCGALMAQACTTTETAFLRAEAIPPAGGRVEADNWQEFADALGRPEHVATSNRTTRWPLPSYLAQRTLEMRLPNPAAGAEPTSGTAVVKTLLYNDILPPLLVLPLRVYARSDEYREENAESAAHRTVVYTPLYAWSWEDGEHEEPFSVRLRGMPLLYAAMRVEAWEPGAAGFHEENIDRLSLNAHQMLWTLGPLCITGEIEESGGDRFKGYVATPLFLGGMLGVLLWSDLHIEATSFGGPGKPGYLSWHGPLFGLPTYVSFGNEDARMRLVLTGALWTDYSRDRQADISSIHGPLWGMFGWGRSKGRPKVQLFWIPIKL